ncbi:MAG: tetratricopeptide repeat protein [Alphaproteobacteria bacterium]|nr:tetratricopeptide repeat protein [Alphaproteobacteria bacterium]
MAAPQANPALFQALGTASQALRAGDPDAADRALAPMLGQDDPRVLHLAGLVRMHQERHEEAAELFARARAADPGEALLAFSHGTALRWLQRGDEAAQAFKAAVALKPDYGEAYFEAINAFQEMGDLKEAESLARQWLRVMPENVRARLSLGDILLAARRLAEAEMPLREALAGAASPEGRAVLHQRLGLALRRQHKNEDALAHYESAVTLDPDPVSDAIRVEILQDLKRYDEAVLISQSLVARDPANPQWHKLHNDLMYRLGHEDYLKSYGRAPQSAELLMSKAYFLTHEKRGEEAHEAYSAALALAPDDKAAAIGVGNALNLMQRPGEALKVFEQVMAKYGEDANLLSCAAEGAILSGDPERAAMLCEKNLALAPHDQVALAMLGTAWRMLGDDRDEALNGYDSLIRIYDLEPPDGFSDMEIFNAELNAWLDRVHPATREYLDQSLRGGSQTPDKLFGAGHELVEKIQRRIHEAVERYIADMKPDEKHPLAARRARGFDYTGSWSSRLKDCGFHTNHIHPEGWISSCYYVALPKAVEDTEGRQGWIKFGEPALDVALKDPIRRTIQPRAGRLVLFPSYMWHGTVPFRDTQPRTTIAFDAVPI